MSHPTYLVIRVEIMELICILNAVRSGIFVVNFPVYSIQFPPTVSFTIIESSLCGCTLTIMCEYVTVRPTGILLRAKKRIVFVPFSIFLSIFLQVIQIPLTICRHRHPPFRVYIALKSLLQQWIRWMDLLQTYFQI